MPIITIPVCESFKAAPGTGISWTQVPPTGAVIESIPGSPWPFTAASPIRLPSPASPSATLQPGLIVGHTYSFRANCCDHKISVIIT
jgi:hypothetical protein